MNTQTQEALKMAIEAFERWEDTYKADCTEVINACKEALKPHPDCDEACMFQCEMENKHNQWQGLTDDEIFKIGFMDYMDGDETIEVVREIEAKLKEKNHV